MTLKDSPSSRTMRSRIEGSAPNRSRHRASPSTTGRSGAWGRSSALLKNRPSAGEILSASESEALAGTATTRCGSPPSARTIVPPSRNAATCSSVLVPASRSRKFCAENANGTPSGVTSKIRTSLSGLSKGSGRSSTASTTLNTAVAPPMPTPRISTAIAPRSGCRRRLRKA